MKAAKIITIVFLVYVGVVAAFESLLGYFQPAGQGTLVIATTDDGGTASERVLSRLESDGHIYVAANHWPRAWYSQALENPQVKVGLNDNMDPYTAVPVSGAEHDRVNNKYPHGMVFRILTGFPPRYFVRLDPETTIIATEDL
ncbi:MAG: hypothetical protein VB948_00930 [Pseudomonadales bacterium]